MSQQVRSIASKPDDMSLVPYGGKRGPIPPVVL